MMKVYRYKLSNEIMEEMEYFSKMHQYDERKTYKEEWDKWWNREEIQVLINKETERLREIGFQGDISKKMFISSRYYFRKKKDEKIENNKSLKEKKKGCCKLRFNHDELKLFDEHILEHIHQCSPSCSFNDFIQTKIDIFKKTHENVNEELLLAKIKKTYKNRYFIHQKNT